MSSILLYSLDTNIYIFYTVADEVDIISGGSMISKVRLMEEDNEVYSISSFAN